MLVVKHPLPITHYLLNMEITATPIGSYAPDFELPGIDRAVHHLARYLEQYRAVGVIFICNRCPYVESCIERLKQIQADFQPQGFTLIGINANDATLHPEESFDRMQSFAEDRQFNFPYLRDPTQDVARCFGAQVTPQAFLLDNRGVLRYMGSIDDSPKDPAQAQVPFLRNAIAQLLNEEAIAIPVTDPVGCSLIKWRP